ncbi:MarR family winged helix-turn-helix transcriptional regulator [Phenylobacterium ferrooxidans]|uniref:MarR family winged helix-turn-helix transcriptional regulator n=1 Tax=Phenylobacterium ferrooxidans TaxID=2982689 RepID=UPI0036708994
MFESPLILRNVVHAMRRPERGLCARGAGPHIQSAWRRLSPGGGYSPAARVVSQRMLDLGLTGSMWRVLVYLQREDGRSQADLAKELEVSRASLGQMIDRLERSGHVRRRAHPDDRRIWRVFLTEKSREVMPSVGEKAQALHQQTFGRLAEDEHRAFIATLMTLRDSLR